MNFQAFSSGRKVPPESVVYVLLGALEVQEETHSNFYFKKTACKNMVAWGYRTGLDPDSQN